MDTISTENICMGVNQTNINPYVNSVDFLSEGLLHIYQPSLTNVKKQLKELTDKQKAILDQLHEENLSLSKNQYSADLEEIFNKMKVYQTKLLNIKKDIKVLHDRSTKLKKRALKLQQLKEKEEYFKQQKELKIKKEEELIGPSKMTVD